MSFFMTTTMTNKEVMYSDERHFSEMLQKIKNECRDGSLVCVDYVITIRFDNQTGKFVEVEHDEARRAEAYEILRVLNYE